MDIAASLADRVEDYNADIALLRVHHDQSLFGYDDALETLYQGGLVEYQDGAVFLTSRGYDVACELERRAGKAEMRRAA